MSKHSDPVEDGADGLKGSRFCLRLPLTFAQSASRKIHAPVCHLSKQFFLSQHKPTIGISLANPNLTRKGHVRSWIGCIIDMCPDCVSSFNWSNISESKRAAEKC